MELWNAIETIKASAVGRSGSRADESDDTSLHRLLSDDSNASDTTSTGVHVCIYSLSVHNDRPGHGW